MYKTLMNLVLRTGICSQEIMHTSSVKVHGQSSDTGACRWTAESTRMFNNKH
jgi:hypothetical protein